LLLVLLGEEKLLLVLRREESLVHILLLGFELLVEIDADFLLGVGWHGLRLGELLLSELWRENRWAYELLGYGGVRGLDEGRTEVLLRDELLLNDGRRA
jgi:hypothetical protein